MRRVIGKYLWMDMEELCIIPESRSKKTYQIFSTEKCAKKFDFPGGSVRKFHFLIIIIKLKKHVGKMMIIRRKKTYEP